jgi:hypothetical protein
MASGSGSTSAAAGTQEPCENLQSILGPEHSAYDSEDDHSMDGITLCQNSSHDDIFRLPRMQDMFESLLFWPTVAMVQAEPVFWVVRGPCGD